MGINLNHILPQFNYQRTVMIQHYLLKIQVKKNSNNNLSTSDDTALQMIIRRPLHELHTLHLRSEVMEHNITLGLNVLSYLQDTCGLSPKRASEFVRPILTNETQMIETKGIRTFTPIKHYALKQYGQIAFSKKVTPFVRKKK